MHKIMFSCYAQDSGNVNSWLLGGTVLQTFLKVPPGSDRGTSQTPRCKFTQFI